MVQVELVKIIINEKQSEQAIVLREKGGVRQVARSLSHIGRAGSDWNRPRSKTSGSSVKNRPPSPQVMDLK